LTPVCNLLFLIALFFLHAAATTAIYTLSLHDALPISARGRCTAIASTSVRVRRSRRTPSARAVVRSPRARTPRSDSGRGTVSARSEEHTSELQSRENLVCRLLLEKKKKKK